MQKNRGRSGLNRGIGGEANRCGGGSKAIYEGSGETELRSLCTENLVEKYIT